MRIRRSIAWCCGSDFNRARQHLSGPTDAICLDLEDTAPPKMKPTARLGALEMLRNWDFRGKERILRINGVGTEDYEKDMREVVTPGLPDAIRLPKTERAEDVLRLDRELSEIEYAAGLAKDSIEVLAMIESPLGVINAYEIASCCKRVTALSIGMEDLTAEMGVPRSYDLTTPDLLYARQHVVLAAKAAGIQAIDSGFNKSQDFTFNRPYNEASRQMGFDGRSVADPEQAEVANEIYRPTAEELDWARRAKAQYEENAARGEDGGRVDGRHLCAAAYAKALACLTLEEQIEAAKQRNVDYSKESK